VSSAGVISRSPSEANREQDARARAWGYVFDCYRKKKATLPVGPDKSGPHDAILRNTKGGSHVDQRPG
jgi:hypothetical protein